MNDEISTNDTLVSNMPIGRQSPLDNDNDNDSDSGSNNECDTDNDNDDDTITSANNTTTTTTTTTTTSDNNSRGKCNMLKNIFLLSGMWGLGLGASFVQIPSAQNVLTTTGHDSISTVPLGLIILLSAPMAIIIPKLMTIYGEKIIFVFAAFLGCIGAIIQMIGVLISHNNGSTSEIAMLMVGAAVQSFTYASTNNIRFAVAYFSIEEFLSKATAFVILGGAGGALLGPFLSNTTRYIFDEADYAGNFLQIAVMYFLYGILAMFVDFATPPPSNNTKTNNNKQVDNNEDNRNKQKKQR
jgi:MFS family permease